MPSVNITPGAHLLIWATGKDRTNTSNPLHANFAISRDGEAILLTSPDGNRIDEIPQHQSLKIIPTADIPMEAVLFSSLMNLHPVVLISIPDSRKTYLLHKFLMKVANTHLHFN